MNNILKVVIVTVVAIFMIQATCGKPKPVTITHNEEIVINDWVYFHNMAITFDGSKYITLNGGNEEYCTINTYDEEAIYDDTYDVGIDGRSIFYNAKQSKLYAKIYGLDLYEIDLDNEEATLKYSNIFEENNSSVAFSPDGKYVYELNEKGYLRFIDLTTGKFIKQIKINTYNTDFSYLISIAASDKYFFIWGEAYDQIVVLDLNGKYVTTFTLPISGLGFSLSYCNNMLWIAEDADGSTDGASGYWHGYSLTIQ